MVGQIHGTYIVAQMEDGFYLIDQHAAQERIKYEYFKEKVGEVDPNERQTLLLPLTFHYSQDEAFILKENRQALEEVGVFLEEFGHLLLLFVNIQPGSQKVLNRKSSKN